MAELPKSEITRARILSTGRELILKGGFAGVGLSRLLAECGVPKGSFYYYFASKEDFGCAVLKDYVAEYLARFDELCEVDAPAGDKLAAYWASWLDEARSEGIASRCLVVKLASEVADFSESMREILDDGVSQLTGRIADLLRAGARDGSIRPLDDTDVMAQILYSQWLGAATLSKLCQNDVPLRRVLEDTRCRLSPQ